MRPRWALAGLAAVPLIAPSCGQGSVLGPCPSSTYDVCLVLPKTVLESQYVGHPHHPDSINVEAWLTVQTNRTPSALHAIADLQWWDRRTGTWLTDDSETYGLHNLPPPGTTRRVNPRLEAYCTPGRWRVRVIYSVKSSTGQAQHGTVYFPGPSEKSAGKRLRCKPPR